jgi:hypothetical protein
VPRHPPYATITWPPQIQDARAHYPRIKTPATNPATTTRTPWGQTPKTPGVFTRVAPGKQPTGCPLRHPTARPQPLRENQGKRSLIQAPIPTPPTTTAGKTRSTYESASRIRLNTGCERLLRKEVIQPHLPVRLPCYDFVPIASPTFTRSPLKEVRPQVSGVADFRDVTGGVYKARERIHRGVADPRLLATPPSWGRVADPNPN